MRTGFGNNVKGALASDISALQTSIPVMPGTGALFAQTLDVESALENASYPTQVGQIYAKLTICDEQETVFEIVHLMSVSGDNLKVIRGQEGTSARSWYLADTISNFATRGSEVGFVQVEELQSGKYQAFAAGGTANALTVSIPSTFYLNGGNTFALRLPLVIFPQLANTGPVTLQLTVSGQVVGTFPVVKGGSLPLGTGDIAPGTPFIVTYAAGKSAFVMSGSASADIGVDEWRHYFAPAWSTEFAPYIRGMVVRYSNTYWISLVNANSAVPGSDASKWQTFTFERASNAEAVAGTATEKIITPPSLQYALSAIDFAPPWSATFAPYIRGATVRYSGVFWVSLVSGNTSTPGADSSKWQKYLFQEATEDDVDAATNHERIITPPLLAYGLGSLDFGLFPIGGAVIWFTSTPPDGWLEANGQAFNKTDNPKLAAVYTSGRVPDMRGYFPRGWAHGSGVDPDSARGINSIQTDAIRNITGEFVADVGEGYLAGNPKFVKGAFKDIGFAGNGDRGVIENEARRYSFDASRVVDTAPENRPLNKAVMFIIKTDGATPLPQDPTPDAVTVSPALIQGGTGDTGHITASVLPSSMAGSYPITYTSSDSSVVTVDANGNWQITGGGNAYITASISTGMGATVTVNAFSMLTSLSMAAIPSIAAGGSYTLQLTKTPSGANEPMTYTTTNGSVANVSEGVVFGVSAGTATVTATGQYSGVSASQTVTVTSVPSETAGRLLNIIVMESSGTYTPSAGAAMAIIDLVSGGGNQAAVATPASGITVQSATGGGGFLRVKLALTGVTSFPVTVGAGGGMTTVGTFATTLYASVYGAADAWSTTVTSTTDLNKFIPSASAGISAGSAGSQITELLSIPGTRGGLTAISSTLKASPRGTGGYSAAGGNYGQGSNSTGTLDNYSDGYGYGLVARGVETGGTALGALSGGPGVVIIQEYA